MAVAGYDKLAVNRDLLLDLQFREAVGEMARDYAKPHHPVARTPGGSPGGPAWVDLANNLTVLDFNPVTPDWLESPQADTVDLNFTTGAFSLAAWIYLDDLSGSNVIFCRGGDVDGWLHIILNGGIILFLTAQGGATQGSSSAVGEIVISTWYLAGVTRSGASVRTYKNGADVTDLADTHVDPLTAARKLLIGVANDEVSAPMDGKMWRPRIWDRCLSADEMRDIFAMERSLFGV